MLGAAGPPQGFPGAGGAVSGRLCPGSAGGRADRSWERTPSLGGRLRTWLKIPRPGSCLASSGLCGSSPQHSQAPRLSSVSLCRDKAPLRAATGQNFHSVAVGQHFQAAACSWFGFFIVVGSGGIFFFLFPMPTPLTSSPYQERQSWVRYPGCCHSGCVWRKWPLPAATDQVPRSLGAAGELMFPSVHPSSSDPLWG